MIGTGGSAAGAALRARVNRQTVAAPARSPARPHARGPASVGRCCNVNVD